MKKSDAYKEVKAAIKRGGLIRPEQCERCGSSPPRCSDGRSAIQAHHHDYSKPLEVEWICPKCHRKETPLPKVIGAPNYGEKNGFSKLTCEKVTQMKELRKSGYSYQEIALKFGVNKSTARRAITGINWSELAAAPQEPKP